MAAKATTLSVENAWNAVALEERIELISRAQAEGIVAAITYLLFIGAVAYGFDKIWVLAGGSVGTLLVIPLFASYSWRRTKPALILSYLAVRSVARRYAYGFNITDFDIVLIFRGRMEERFSSEEDEVIMRQRDDVDIDSPYEREKEVWICLMRGAIVILSEKKGGAKLEFIAPIMPDCTCRKASPQDNAPHRGLILTGAGPSKGRKIVLSSTYPGALYVFERQLARLLVEVTKGYERLMALKRQQEDATPND